MIKLFFAIFILSFVAIYFIPSFVAIARKHKYVLQITILNAFLGWSFIAWVAALIWGTTNYTDTESKTKGSWIIIGIFAVISILPILIYSLIPTTYKSNFIEETQYKNITYTNHNGKQLKQETKIKQVNAN